MISFLTTVAALFITAASSQSYGSGSGGSGPVVSSCPTQFAISSFSASCIRRGTGCHFSFNVAPNESLSTSVTCTASFPDVAEALPLVPYTYCTGDHTIAWAWAPLGPANSTATAYALVITDATLGLKAAKLWDASDYPMTPAGVTEYQNYTGDASFVI